MTTNKKPVIWMSKGHPEPDPGIDITETFVKKFQEHFDIVWNGDLMKNPELGKKIQGACLSWLNYETFLQQKHLMPNLKIWSNFGAGYEHIHEEDYGKDGVIVTYTPDVQSGSVADHALALMLSAAREIISSVHWTREIAKMNVNLFGAEVSGATLGIVGLGSIGFQIAQRAVGGFNMKILYHQRTCKSKIEENSIGGAEYYSCLHDMLPHCDFLVLACPLTTVTENLISTKEFSLMKPNAILVNVARGKVVDHDALVNALNSGQIRGAALDVTYPEPLPLQHPLLEMNNVIVTPHIASATFSSRLAVFQAGIDNLKAVLIDKITPQYIINH